MKTLSIDFIKKSNKNISVLTTFICKCRNKNFVDSSKKKT